jgi:dihydropteroate synthase
MYTLNCKGRILAIEQPLVMGIINITPDSFYTASRAGTVDAVLIQAEKMLQDGATILDIGGQSTRPGSKKITAEDELQRVIGPIQALTEKFPGTFISVDTYYSVVAKEAVQAGACIINDISAGGLDDKMIETVAALRVPYVLMHMQGTPQTMQQHPSYSDVTKEVLDFFIQKKKELEQKGIKDVITDPGLGFGKTVEHNFQLLRNLTVFSMLGTPMLLGLSRKSMIGKTLGIETEQTLNGTTVLNTIGLMNGASILRVHDVKQAKEAITLYTKMLTAG